MFLSKKCLTLISAASAELCFLAALILKDYVRQLVLHYIFTSEPEVHPTTTLYQCSVAVHSHNHKIQIIYIAIWGSKGVAFVFSYSVIKYFLLYDDCKPWHTC